MEKRGGSIKKQEKGIKKVEIECGERGEVASKSRVKWRLKGRKEG